MDEEPSYITRSFTVAAEGTVKMSGMQIIGWDPAAKTIRSWTFDSDGGFAEATWTFQKDRWFVRTKASLPTAAKASMINVIKPVDKNSYTWQTVERTAGGELLPNIDEVLIVRRVAFPARRLLPLPIYRNPKLKQVTT